jgi:asparagine synthase (glutamine-hydrolysing)
MRADVAIGSCLSGGLDSSTIVCATRELIGDSAFAGQFTAVSAVFDESRVDERRYIDAVIAHTGARSARVTLDASGIEAMASDMLWHQDEPFGSTSICAQGAVFRTAAKCGLKVMLDGQGADEALAGYHWLFGPALAQLLRSGNLRAAGRMVSDRRSIHGARARAQMLQAALHLLPGTWRTGARRYHRARGGGDWLDGPAFRPFLDRPGPFEVAAQELGLAGRTDLGAMCVSLTAATSLPMLLHWEDRSSMMHGIEARVPFLDHRLVEFAIGLGGRHKMRGAETKVVLRRAMADRLPQAVLTRQDKLGFATPEQEWAQGPMRTYLRAGVVKTLDTFPTLMNREATLALVDATLDGSSSFNFTPWRILMVGLWGERFGLSV